MSLVDLQLGPLVSGQRVLDGERVQAERLRHLAELVLGRFVQTDPDEVTVPGQLVADRGQVGRLAVHRDPDAPAIDRVVDDHDPEGSPVRLPTMATVILLRHGRTTANASGVLAGRAAGVRLDDVGRAQSDGGGGSSRGGTARGHRHQPAGALPADRDRRGEGSGEQAGTGTEDPNRQGLDGV